VGSGQIKAVELVAELLSADTTVAVKLYQKPDKSGQSAVLPLIQNPALGNLLSGSLVIPWTPKPAMTDPLTLDLDHNTMKDLWLAITWGKA
jgi:hypothetical protein